MTIHDAIHTDRLLAKKALLRKKSLNKSLELIQQKIDIMKEHSEGAVGIRERDKEWDIVNNLKMISGEIILVASVVIGAFASSQ